jgi:hypothetical protein
MPGHPVITGLTNPVLVGGMFTIYGRNFSKKPMVNFFVKTGTGPANEGPITPSTISTTQLQVPVPVTKNEGEGFVAVEVVNTDQPKYPVSNLGYALLQGFAGAGLPSITGLNGHGLAPTSIEPGFGIANVETILGQNTDVVINGNGFDVTHGVAVDVFCGLDCPPLGKLTPAITLYPGNSKLTANSITFTLPATAPTGPGSIQVSNAGAAGTYTAKSEGVSVPIGARIIVIKVTQNNSTLTVEGAGFSKLTVINFFNAQVNLGGLKSRRLGKDPAHAGQFDEIHLHEAGKGGGGPGVRAGAQPSLPPVHQQRQRPLRRVHAEMNARYLDRESCNGSKARNALGL